MLENSDLVTRCYTSSSMHLEKYAFKHILTHYEKGLIIV